MELHLFEGSNGPNWGKFAVGRPGDTEWAWRSEVDRRFPLLSLLGWGPEHLWVMDLQTGEGAFFKHGGHARNDLAKHRIWVCVLFEAFLEWLYAQDVTDLAALPRLVQLDVPFAFHGYRRPGDAQS